LLHLSLQSFAELQPLITWPALKPFLSVDVKPAVAKEFRTKSRRALELLGFVHRD